MRPYSRFERAFHDMHGHPAIDARVYDEDPPQLARAVRVTDVFVWMLIIGMGTLIGVTLFGALTVAGVFIWSAIFG